MARYSLLISPRADAAYFAETVKVARAELLFALPDSQPQLTQFGDLRFLTVDVAPAQLPRLLHLSFVQGVFEETDGGLMPLPQSADFALHSDFVWGEKYRGKTNETLTQLLVNLGLLANPQATTLCDPMCGRATTLLWALRYGLDAVGIEQDPSAQQDIHRGLKKWTKIHRQKHKLSQGWVQKASKSGVGRFLDFTAEGHRMRVITGDTADIKSLTQNKTFDILTTDIPYGVQHMGAKANRSPFQVLQAAGKSWVESLSRAGVMVIAFNSYLPKKADLVALYTSLGMVEIETDLSHRMSESIVRDVLLMRKA